MTAYRVRFSGARPYEDVAQAVEHLTFNQRVVSSNLTIFTIYSYRLMDKPSGYGPDIAGSSPAGSTISTDGAIGWRTRLITERF